VGTGSYTRSATDLSIPTTGYPLELSRDYDSTDLVDGPLGYGWSTNLVPRAHLAVYAIAQGGAVQSEADITMPDGERLRFSENADGSFTPPSGRFDTLVKNADGTFDLTLQHTRSVDHFNLDGSLGWMADDYGNKLNYTYDANGQLQEVADGAGSGRYLDVYWGADGRISSVVDNAGRAINYVYDGTGHLITVTNPLGQKTNYSYTPGKYVSLLSEVRDNWDRVITTITYDSQDRVNSYTEDGETWTYTYDYGGNASKTAKTDSAGNRWVFTYNADGQVTSDVAPDGSTKLTTYNADGLVASVTDQVGVKTSYTYDSQGRLSTRTDDDGGSAAVRWVFAYDPNYPDAVTSTTPVDPTTGQLDPNWQGTRSEYYQAGDPAPGALKAKYKVESDGQTADLVEGFTYDSQGRVLSVTDAGGGVTDYQYDSSGNLSQVSRPANNNAGTRPTTLIDHDSLGEVTAVTDPMGAVTSFIYDVLGRRTSVTYPKPDPNFSKAFVVTASYDNYDASTGLLFVKYTDLNGHIFQVGQDQYNRRIQMIDGLGEATELTYDHDLLSAITGPNGYQTSYEYDGLKRPVKTDFPDGAMESYSYHGDGRLHTRTDRNGLAISYSYDGLKRLLKKVYPDSSSIAYSYVGKNLVQVADSRANVGETETFAYDTRFELSSETQGSRGTVTYTYTPEGQVESMSVASGPSTSYTYFPDGSVHTISWSEVSGDFTYSYNLRGQRQQIAFPNGQTRAYTYDLQGRQETVANLDPSGGEIASFTYGYDLDQTSGQPTELGQPTSVTETIPALGLSGSTSTFDYDAVNQLTGADYPPTQGLPAEQDQWTYDAIGNRTSASVNGTTQKYSYQTLGQNPENWQRLLSTGTISYAYDADGNATTRTDPGGTENFAWDPEDRLTSISGSTNSTYAYDFQGRRISISRSGVNAVYLYSGLNAVGSSGSSVTWYVYGPGVDEPLARSKDGAINFYSVDGLGSVVALTDESGAIDTAYLYDAWGNIRASMGGSEGDFGFTGREFSGGALWYFRARQYDPVTGRFLSTDPEPGSDPSGNLYRYVRNSPILLVDPSGTKYRPWSYVWNLDPVRYPGWGDKAPNNQDVPLTIPAGPPEPWFPLPNPFFPLIPIPFIPIPPPPYPPVPVLPSTPPWWDVDVICTPKGWVQIHLPAIIYHGEVYSLGHGKPPKGWPPYKCPPDPSCPLKKGPSK